MISRKNLNTIANYVELKVSMSEVPQGSILGPILFITSKNILPNIKA